MASVYVYEALPVKISAGSVIGTLIIASLSAYTVFSLLSRTRGEANQRTTLQKAFLAALAALCFVLGLWTSQMISLHVMLMPSMSESWFLTFKPGLIVLSVLVPFVVTSTTFILISCSLVDDNLLWHYVLGGSFVGLSLDFMHYSVFFSLPFYQMDYALTETFLALILGVLISAAAAISLLMFRKKWTCNGLLKCILPFLFGCGICGVNYLALSGMSFRAKVDATGAQLQNGEHEWMMVTMAIPVIFAFLLASLIVTVSTVHTLKERRRAFRARPQVVLASISLTSDGRVLATENVSLPIEKVNVDDLDAEILLDLKAGAAIFNWLFTLSFNWDSLLPFLEQATEDPVPSNCLPASQLRDNILSCLKQESASSFGTANGLLKRRILKAVMTLAGRLDIPVTEIGYLYDQTLKFGSTNNQTEFLSLEDETPTCPDFDKGVQGRGTYQHEGVMLFLVRRFPPEAPIGNNGETLNHIAKGLHVTPLLNLRYVLADSICATQEDVDRILIGCQDYVENGTRPVLQPGDTYISLHATRPSSDGSQKVLVYDFAKHQIPSYRLNVSRFSHEMRGWIRSAAHLCPDDVLEVCRNDLYREYTSRRSVVSSKRTSFDTERRTLLYSDLLDFQESLSDSLNMLLRSFPSMPQIRQIAKLSPEVLDISTNGATAHLIVFRVDLSDLKDNAIPFHGSDAGDQLSIVSPIMSSALVYVPHTLFEVSQAVILGNRSKIQTEVREELSLLYPIPHLIQPPEECHLYQSDVGLVSTFSFDSDSDVERRPSLRQKMSFTSLKSWASSSIHTKRRRSRQQIPPLPNMLPIPEAIHADPDQQQIASTAYPPRPLRTSHSWEQPVHHSRHPYLHLQLPAPLVFPHHPYCTNHPNTSLESHDDLYNVEEDTVELTAPYYINNSMQRADVWHGRF